MAAFVSDVRLSEDEIIEAKLKKEIGKLTKSEAIRWLKCLECQNLSQLNFKEFWRK